MDTMTDTLQVGELFAGYGGLGIAVKNTFGASIGWVAEFDPNPSRVLAHQFPTTTNHRDVTTVNWLTTPRADIFSGGSPCQDLAHCGKRAGMRAGTRSGLWESMREGIAAHRPRHVVWENVRGAYDAPATSATDHPNDRSPRLRALARVVGDLTDLGYNVEWRGVRASDIGAPHARFRVFVLATRNDLPTPTRNGTEFATWNTHTDYWEAGQGDLFTEAAPHTDPFPNNGYTRNGTAYALPAIPDPNTVPLLRTPAAAELGGGMMNPDVAREQKRTVRLASQIVHHFHPEQLLPTPRCGDGMHQILRQDVGNPRGRLEDTISKLTVGWGEFQPAITRWENTTGRHAPAPTEPARAEGRHQLSAAFVEWMMGLPAGWVTDPAIWDGYTPTAARKAQIKALGNGVVPQQAEHALRLMLT